MNRVVVEAPAIDWQSEKKRWDGLIERQQHERGEFMRDLLARGATQEEIATHLGLGRQRVARLADYGAVLGDLAPVGAKSSNDLPSERELRPYIQEAAQEVAEERGVTRVRDGRGEVHARAADLYEKKAHVAHNAGNNEWYTPAEIIELARTVLGTIDLDPASTESANEVIKAQRIYTKKDDGLTKEWTGRVWLNPPYSADLIGRFIDKLVYHFGAGDVPAAIALTNNATETAWFQKLAGSASAMCFPAGRVRFWEPGGKPSAPLQGQAIVCLGCDPEEFRQALSGLGFTAVL